MNPPNRTARTLGGDAGFTLIELVIVLVILGLLSSVAIPRYYDLQRDAEVAVNRSWIGALRTAIGIQLAGVVLGKTTGPDPRNSSPAWNRTMAEKLMLGGPYARPTSLTADGTDGWSGYYNATSTTTWSLAYNTSNQTWEILGP